MLVPIDFYCVDSLTNIFQNIFICVLQKKVKQLCLQILPTSALLNIVKRGSFENALVVTTKETRVFHEIRCSAALHQPISRESHCMTLKKRQIRPFWNTTLMGFSAVNTTTLQQASTTLFKKVNIFKILWIVCRRFRAKQFCIQYISINCLTITNYDAQWVYSHV